MNKIVATFRGMHMSPAKQMKALCDYQTDRHTHRRTDTGQNYPYMRLCFAGDTKINPTI